MDIPSSVAASAQPCASHPMSTTTTRVAPRAEKMGIQPAPTKLCQSKESPEVATYTKVDTTYSHYLGSLVTKLNREVAFPKLIKDCSKAIAANTVNQTGWNYMMLSLAANLALNGTSNTTTQLKFIAMQLSMIPIFVILMRLLVAVTPKHHVPAKGAQSNGKHAPQEYVDKWLKRVPDNQNADEWLEEIHLTRESPELLKEARRHDAYAFDGDMWSLDKKGSYIPTITWYGLCFLYLWHASEIAKKNLLYVAFVIDHMGTFGHVFVDTFVGGLWHHVNPRSDIDSAGFCNVILKLALPKVPLIPIIGMLMYYFGVQLSAPIVGFAIFVHFQPFVLVNTNHYFQHGYSKQRLPKLIRKHAFKGFLWKYNILLDDLFHKGHHHTSPESNLAIFAGFMDKLVEQLKSGQTLYVHNPSLNKAIFGLYAITAHFSLLWCISST